MNKTDYKTLRLEIQDGIAQIILSRPPANLIDYDLTHEYLSALDAADNDHSVRVIILRGEGKGLSGGVDIRFLEKFGPTEMKEFLSLFYIKTVERVRALNKPIIAAVHGYAREGACTLAFACDMIIASDDADFGYPGVPNLASPPGMHVWFLQKLIGRMKAAKLILTGDPISANEANTLGLVTDVVPKERLLQHTITLSKRIAEHSPHALKITRELMYRVEDMSFNQVPPTALDAMAVAFGSEDSIEARKAFNEKRKPVWKNT
ncbi:enoyl-CoA hydratase/isomerase family protein [Sneathiella glossodoripedis]|uniref:enoyl-CoA hydratase/isomerase family protein n=1 Tax=Sneathiella glossodoripedis TaxID=418853 RepID=UPI000472FA35|nr:enoyl-CoA hydratase/isomerase family protein [Sneathiella glossodoripedis]